MSFEANAILRALPQLDRDHIAAHLTPCALDQGAVLHAAGSLVERVYFPVSGMVSLLTLMKDGRATETGIIGSEGVVGGAVAFGQPIALHQAIVQIPGQSFRISTEAFASACRSSRHLEASVLAQQFMALLQAQQSAACQALHENPERMCRWILNAADMVGSPRLNFTQEFLSHMLGVRRASVSEVAGKLQASGAIRYRRGCIDILDRAVLERSACECYAVLRQEAGKRRP